MDKIIVINGKGGIGKDTLIEALKNAAPHYIHVSNVSSITPIAYAVDSTGIVKNGKTNAYRKLLSDMKTAIDEYYRAEEGVAYTTDYLNKKIIQWERLCEFGKASHHVLFVHIREPEMIQTFVNAHPDATTMLVKSDRAQEEYGNPADDWVESYNYDYIFDANGTKEEEAKKFCDLIEKILIGG